MAWVNNQFQQYVFDISEFLPIPGNTSSNLTVSLESAYHYGLNVTSRPDAEHFPKSISDDVRYCLRCNRLQLTSTARVLSSTSIQESAIIFVRLRPTLVGIG